MDKIIRQVCPSNVAYSWVNKNEQKAYDLVRHCRNGNENCHFSVPTVSALGVTNNQDVPVARLYSIAGVAFITLAGQQTQVIMESFRGTIISGWPIFFFAMALTFLSGVIVWILERFSNEDEFPKPFYRGSYQGFWWGYVSMTTVGYGDKAPRSILGRLFSLIWILVGISLCGLITSILATSLAGGSSVPKRVMRGQKIGCIDITSHAKLTIIREGGIPDCTTDITVLEKRLASGELYGIAMDVLEFAYYSKKRFLKIGESLWRIEEVFEIPYHFTVAFYSIRDTTQNPNTGYRYSASNWHGCWSDYMSYNKEYHDIMHEMYKSTEEANLDESMYKVDYDSEGVNLFDPESGTFKNILVALIVIIVVVVILGLLFDFTMFLLKRYKKQHNYNSGYMGAGENSSGKGMNGKPVSRQEYLVMEAVDKALRSSEERLRLTERDIKNEISELSRAIRHQMNKNQKRQNGNYQYPTIHDLPMYTMNNMNNVNNTAFYNGRDSILNPTVLPIPGQPQAVPVSNMPDYDNYAFTKFQK